MIALWIAIALKATVWAATMSAAALVVPAQHPQARRRLALLGMWGLGLVPWLPLPSLGISAASISVSTSITAQQGVWQVILAAVWILGAVFLLLRMLRDATNILKMVRQAAASTLSPDGSIEVRFTSAVEGPCMTGWLRPCVLLPFGAASWPEETLLATLRHECQHARQWDGLHRFCAAFIRACFWWNPLMHVLCGIYEAESEVCCDEEAATACSRRHYGEMLLAHATQKPLPAFAMAFARRSGLRVRLNRLFETRRVSRWALSTRWLVVLLLIISAAVLMTSIRVLPPGLAQGISLQHEAHIRLAADPFPGPP